MNPVFFAIHGHGNINFSALERAPDILKYTFFYPISVIFTIVGVAIIVAAIRDIKEIRYEPVMTIVMILLALSVAFLSISFGAMTIIATAGFL